MAVAPKILVILGPTASGKSELALAVARLCSAEILSVDSMQIYRGMDIGTAKPTPAELSQAPHHLINLVEPSETFTVARFVELADGVIADAAHRGAPLVATGGTPLYYKALFHGMFEGPGEDAGLRQRLCQEAPADLHKRLARVDPAAAARIHANDTKRVIRALEVFELTGQPISSLQNEWEQPRLRHAARWIGLAWDREAINRRINARVKAMLADGWLEETRRLLEQHGTLSRTAAEATGYHELLEHLAGRCSREDAAEAIKIATRQLARRQMKWLKRFPDVRWIDGAAPLREKLALATEAWQDRGR